MMPFTYIRSLSTPRSVRRGTLLLGCLAAAWSLVLPAAAQAPRLRLASMDNDRPAAANGGTAEGGGRSSPGCHNYQRDDGSLESALGGPSIELGWLVRYDAIAGAESIESVSTAWGISTSPPANGTPAKVYVWEDPDDDGDPLNAVLIAQTDVSVQGSGTGTIIEYALDQPVRVSGIFYVGASVQIAAGQYAGPMDASVITPGLSWAFYDATALDPTDLANNDVPPADAALEWNRLLVVRTSGCPYAFTYQGRLLQSGAPVSGVADLRFRLFDALQGGTQVASQVERSGVPVTDGLFTVELSFGLSAFDGTARWMEIDVAFPAGGPYTALSPRQPIGYAPQALYSIRTAPHTHSASELELPANLATTNGANTWTAPNTYNTIPAFNGGTSGSTAPFTVDSTFKVASLNADLLDDLSAIAFAQLATSNVFAGAMNSFTGDVGIGTSMPDTSLHLAAGTDASLAAGSGYLVLGMVAGANMVIDNNEIMVRNNGAASSLYLNGEGGNVVVGDSTGYSTLHVEGASGNSGFRVRFDNNTKVLVSDNGSTSVGSGTVGPANGLRVAGDCNVIGSLTKGGGSFKIDHPLDPANWYLYHSFVESPDMMNIYNGNVVTDEQGYAVVELPDWFEALNRDFRYQLTVLDDGNSDSWTLAKIVQEVAHNRFTIRTSAPHTKVSWQVTGIREDAWAEQNRIQVEVEKEPENRGRYLHPEAFGLTPERGVDANSEPDALDQPAATQQR